MLSISGPDGLLRGEACGLVAKCCGDGPRNASFQADLLTGELGDRAAMSGLGEKGLSGVPKAVDRLWEAINGCPAQCRLLSRGRPGNLGARSKYANPNMLGAEIHGPGNRSDAWPPPVTWSVAAASSATVRYREPADQ